MFEYLFMLYGWLPGPLQIAAGGVFAVLAFWALMKIVGLIMDIFPLL